MSAEINRRKRHRREFQNPSLPVNTAFSDCVPDSECIHVGIYHYVGTKGEAIRMVNEFYEKYHYLTK